MLVLRQAVRRRRRHGRRPNSIGRDLQRVRRALHGDNGRAARRSHVSHVAPDAPHSRTTVAGVSLQRISVWPKPTSLKATRRRDRRAERRTSRRQSSSASGTPDRCRGRRARTSGRRHVVQKEATPQGNARGARPRSPGSHGQPLHRPVSGPSAGSLRRPHEIDHRRRRSLSPRCRPGRRGASQVRTFIETAPIAQAPNRNPTRTVVDGCREACRRVEVERRSQPTV